jgi:hypothetical protein
MPLPHGFDARGHTRPDVRFAGFKRVDAKEHKRIDREIRRLNAEFGMGAGRPGMVTWIVVSLLIITLVGAMMLLMPIGPGEAAVGRVDGITLAESDQGTRLLARVTVGAVQGLVPVPAGAMCAAGDRIDLVESRTRLNVRYALGPGGCMKPR